MVGPIPGLPGLLDRAVPEATLQRWDRWWDLASAGEPRIVLEPARLAWRLLVRAGLLGPGPVAGCFRLGRDAAGRIYPFAILRQGALPDPSDPWFDAAEALVQAATEDEADGDALLAQLARLPPVTTAQDLGEGVAVLWRDDWTVQELVFASAADLADFPVRLAADAPPEDEVAPAP